MTGHLDPLLYHLDAIPHSVEVLLGHGVTVSQCTALGDGAGGGFCAGGGCVTGGGACDGGGGMTGGGRKIGGLGGGLVP